MAEVSCGPSACWAEGSEGPQAMTRACLSAGSALTTFNKGGVNLNPKVIAHRSSATRGEMLVNTKAYRQFCHKANINDQVRAAM